MLNSNSFYLPHSLDNYMKKGLKTRIRKMPPFGGQCRIRPRTESVQTPAWYRRKRLRVLSLTNTTSLLKSTAAEGTQSECSL